MIQIQSAGRCHEENDASDYGKYTRGSRPELNNEGWDEYHGDMITALAQSCAIGTKGASEFISRAVKSA